MPRPNTLTKLIVAFPTILNPFDPSFFHIFLSFSRTQYDNYATIFKLIIINNYLYSMALMNAKVSQFIWYGLASGITFWGLTLYKPKYYLCLANVQRI